MKKNLLVLRMMLLSLAILFAPTVRNEMYAQTEITVEQGFNTLKDALVNHPGATLVLTRGSEYVNDQNLIIMQPTIIKGEKEPANDPPALIRVFANPGEAGQIQMIEVPTSITLSDIAMIGTTFDEQIVSAAFTITQAGASISMDHCYLQGWDKLYDNGNSYDSVTLFQKNCIHYNMAGINWDNATGLGYEWAGNNMNLEQYNNTYFCFGRVLAGTGTGPDGVQSIDHNTYVLGWGDTFYPFYDKDITIKNSLFHDTQVRGYVGERKNQQGEVIWPGDFNGDWIYDSLMGDVSIYPHELDSTGAGRGVTISNNTKMYSQYVLDFFETQNVTPQPFFVTTGKVFANDYGWNFENNLLQEDGNTVDPQFTDPIPDAAYANMFLSRINRSLPAEQQDPNYPFYNGWILEGKNIGEFVWPLPINLKPTNQQLWNAGDDGYPLGDLNWFGPEVVAAWENDEDNPLLTSVKIINKESNQSVYVVNNILQFKGFDNVVEVEIYSILGSKMLSVKNGAEINISNLKNGIYIVKVNKESTTFKIIKS
jgi:hypothetical protein